MFENLAEKFQYELNPGERIIWVGQSQQGLTLKPSDAVMIPFSLLWGGFATFWEFGAVSLEAPIFSRLWGIPFVLISLYMIIGRFFFDAFRRSRTYYALTNERALILTNLLNYTTKSIDFKKLPEISITTNGDGQGSIIFGTPSSFDWMYDPGFLSGVRGYTPPPRFEMINEARKVYQHIQQLRRENV